LDEPKSLEQYISDFKITNVKTKGQKLVLRETDAPAPVPVPVRPLEPEAMMRGAELEE
jgi:hypothetical protein